MDYFKDCKTSADVKKTYRELAKIHHPDHKGDPEVFKEIQKQYENWKPSKEPPKGKKYTTYDDDITQDDTDDPFGFKSNTNYNSYGSTEYADIRWNHPIFNHLNFARQNASRFHGLWNKELKNSEHWEILYNLMRVKNFKYSLEIDKLEKELQKKKASVTRLKNTIKKMQNK